MVLCCTVPSPGSGISGPPATDASPIARTCGGTLDLYSHVLPNMQADAIQARNQRPERESQQITGPDKSKRKTHRVEAAGSAPLNLRPKWSTGTSILRPRSLEWLREPGEADLA
jgi:hypothetical protein